MTKKNSRELPIEHNEKKLPVPVLCQFALKSFVQKNHKTYLQIEHAEFH